MIRVIGLIIGLVLIAEPVLAQNYPDSRLEQIRSSKTIRVGYRSDAAPFSFVGDKGEPVGYTIDLCKLIVRAIEQDLAASPLRIQWVAVSNASRFDAVAKNTADMECGADTVSLERLKLVDFSSVIFVETTAVAIKAASSFRTIGDMAGKTIAVISGTSNQKALEQAVVQNKLGAKLVPVKDRAEGVAALEDGKVDGFASDRLLLVGARFKDGKAFTVLPEELSFEPYGIVLPRGDWALRLAVNRALARGFRNGQIGEIFNGWFAQVGLRPGAVLTSAFILGALPE
jgi:ABC-type amino acid transport substrate-binding protein